MNDLFKFLYHKGTPGNTSWYPFLAIYYLTYACQFRCPYCSDGSGTPYYKLNTEAATAGQAIQYLTRIRSYCQDVVLSGGEPLEHSQFSAFIKQIPALRFRQVILTTNGFAVDKHLETIAAAVDSLVFSLDTFDHGKADAWHGVGSGSLAKILDNIEQADRYHVRRYQISISSVVTPNNIEDLYMVYQYAKQRNYIFAAAPQLMGVKAHPDLFNNPNYIQFYNFLIAEKKKKGPVFGSQLYLEYLRDFKKFKCFPFTMLVVAPQGEVFYPCLEIGHPGGHIMANMSLHRLRQVAARQFGPQPACDIRCHSACALGFALLLQNPLSAIKENFLAR
jgi:MoaA/NifB/PqqE/SkfB family radical SAM enzyme